MSGYLGNQPVPQATQTRDAFTATAGQTSFATSGYTPNFLDVFLNGVKLAAADYTATNGSDVVLASGAVVNDILEVVAYTTFNTALATNAVNLAITGNLDVDGGTIKLDGNYPNGVNNVALGNTALDTASGSNGYSVAIGSNALTAMTSGGSNVAVGYASAAAMTTGGNNVSVGSEAMDATTTASNNVAVGSAALGSNTTASNNTAVGYQAGYSNTTGQEITAVGRFALNANTTGSNSTATGVQSLQSNTTGADNASFGRLGLGANTTGSSNTSVGSAALRNNTTASNNTAVGYETLLDNTTGAQNTSVGFRSLYNNTTASNNTALGQDALYTNTTGANNVALGHSTLVANTTASNNVAIGYQSLLSNTTASGNVAIGDNALRAYQTGGDNVVIGRNAGYTLNGNGNCTFLGRGAGFDTTGGNNTFVGYGSGSGVTSGAKNTIVGLFNGNQSGLDIRTSSAHIVLSDGDGNPRLYLNSTGELFCQQVYTSTTGTSANVAVTSNGMIRRSTSSLRYKNTVNDATHGLTELMTLRPVTYKGNNDGDTVYGGLIAEEVHDAGLTEFVTYNDDNEPDALAYGNMVSLCIKAIQELSAKNDALSTALAAALARITTLEGE